MLQKHKGQHERRHRANYKKRKPDAEVDGVSRTERRRKECEQGKKSELIAQSSGETMK